MTRTVLIAALRAEARAFERAIPAEDADAVLVVVGGAGPGAAARAVEAHPDAGAFVSWGCAGALDPSFGTGLVVVPETVVGPAGETFDVDPAWRATLIARLPDAAGGGTRVAGVETPATSGTEKRALARRLGASIVDMESAAIAQAAGARGVPFLVVRSVIDPVDAAVPGWTAACIRADGRVDLARFTRELARAPGDLAAVIANGWRFRRSLGALSSVAARAGECLHWRDRRR